MPTQRIFENSTRDTGGLKEFLLDSIHQRYPYLDRTKISLDDHRINHTDYMYPNLNSSEYSDPIIWFRYENKKFIMREQLESYIQTIGLFRSKAKHLLLVMIIISMAVFIISQLKIR